MIEALLWLILGVLVAILLVLLTGFTITRG